MNTATSRYPELPDSKTWERPDMAAALHVRDWTRIYQQLQKFGYSQQKIARYTGQSQPEVSAIIHGRRVMAYDLQKRMAIGLGIPLCRIGFNACCACCAHTAPTEQELLLLPAGPLETRERPIPSLPQ